MIQLVVTGKIVKRGDELVELAGKKWLVMELHEKFWTGADTDVRIWYIYAPEFLVKRLSKIGSPGSFIGVTARDVTFGKVFTWQAQDSIGIVFAADVWLL